MSSRLATTLVAAAAVAVTCSANATTWYVSPSGNDTNPGTQAAPFQHIAKANGLLRPGDTAVLRGGTYSEAINPTNSGAPGQPITYTAFTGEAPNIVGVPNTGFLGEAAHIDSNYIILDGLTLQHPAAMTGQTAVVKIAGNNNIVRNSTISSPNVTDLDARAKIDGIDQIGVELDGNSNLLLNNHILNMSHVGVIIRAGTGATGRFNIIRGNTIENVLLDAVRITAENTAQQIMGNLIENNTMHHSWSSDGVQTDAPRDPAGIIQPLACGNVIRNNTIYDNAENGVDLKGACQTVVEGNTIFGTRGDSDGCFPLLGQGVCDRSAPGGINHGSAAKSDEIIVRQNIIYDNYTGIIAQDPSWIVYNNTVVNNNRDFTGPNSTFTSTDNRPPFTGLDLPTNDAVVKNNLVGDHNSVEISFDGNRLRTAIDGNMYFNRFQTPAFMATVTSHWAGVSFSSYLATLAGYTTVVGKDAHASITGDPAFVNVPARPTMAMAGLNFELSAASPAIDHGVGLTATVGAGNGTSIQVADARYFFDGFGITSGDTIKVGTGPNVTVTAVDYAHNILTVNSSISWMDGTPVNLPYSGMAPDVGALEFGGSGAQLIISGVTASSHRNADVPQNVLDGDLDTDWSAAGDGQYIQFDLGSTQTIKLVQIAFLLGDIAPFNTRQYTFEIQTSADGMTFATVGGTRISSGTTTAPENFSLPSSSARYVRILGHGSNVNTVNAYTEVRLFN